MNTAISVLLTLAGLIQLPPVIGVTGPERLSSLYGISFNEPNLIILMRHRAILFGFLGLFLIAAAFKPALQPAAFVVGIVCVASFIWISWSVGNYNAEIARVVWADVLALICLIVSVALYYISNSTFRSGLPEH